MKKDINLIWLMIGFVIYITMVKACKGESLFTMDKAAHFGLSYVLSDSVGTLFANGLERPQARLVGVGTSIVFGVGKELTDKRFSYADLTADITGALTPLLFHKWFYRKGDKSWRKEPKPNKFWVEEGQ